MVAPAPAATPEKAEAEERYIKGLMVKYGLSRPAARVYLHIIKNTYDGSLVFFNSEKESSSLGYRTSQSLRRGIADLIEWRFIAPGPVESSYWLNPERIGAAERLIAGKEGRLNV